METPELLLDALAATGWTRAELARQAGIPQSVLSAYEHRSREPSVAALNRILLAAGRQLQAGPGPGQGRSGGPFTSAGHPVAQPPKGQAGGSHAVPTGSDVHQVGRAASLGGVTLAAAIGEDTRRRAAALRAVGVVPTLAVIVGTTDEASARYVRSLSRAAGRVDVACEAMETTAEGLADAVVAASVRSDIHGVVIQTPLPPGLTTEEVSAGLDPAKDVDGAGVSSAGRLALGLRAFAPATAQAVVELLAHHGVVLEGRRVAVVGRSNVVGRPLAQLLTDRHATVTVCHSRTVDLAATTAAADVLVAAVGRPGLVGSDHVGPGAVVVDVGTNVGDDGVLRGDVDPAVADSGAAGLTPVPGGVGPVTVAILLRHTVAAAERAAAKGAENVVGGGVSPRG